MEGDVFQMREAVGRPAATRVTGPAWHGMEMQLLAGINGVKADFNKNYSQYVSAKRLFTIA